MNLDALIKPDTNYSLLSSSEFLRNMITNYVIMRNSEVGILTERSIFGKMLKVSDTDKPNSKSIIISYVERDQALKFETIDIDSHLVELLFEMHNFDKEVNEHHIKYLNQKLKHKDKELCYYMVSAVLGLPKITTDAIDGVINNTYKGIHTLTEKYRELINFILMPNETSLHRILQIFHEEDYGSLVYCISCLVDNVPAWIQQQYSETLEDIKFTRILLKIALIIIKSTNREQFILHILKEIIYGS